jgi:hypothetical protein
MMGPSGFEPWLARRTSVPAARDWINEIKHDRPIVEKEGGGAAMDA